MSVASIVTSLVRSYQRRRQAARTEFMIASLPSDVRKDIGWPDARATSRVDFLREC